MSKLPNTIISFYFHFSKKYWFSFVIFYIAPIFIVFETCFIPYSLKLIIDIISIHDDNRQNIFKEITSPLVFLLVSWLGSMILLRLVHWWEAYVIPKFEADIRISIFKYVIQHSYGYFTKTLTGDITNKIQDLSRALETVREVICWNFISTASTVVVTLFMMYRINYLFSLILGTWVIIHFVLTSLFTKSINSKSQINAEHKSILNGSISDAISNIILIKLFPKKGQEANYILKKQNVEISSNKNLIIAMNIFQVLIYIAITSMLMFIIYFLIVTWQKNLITNGDFVFIFNMIFFITQQMWYLSCSMANLFRDIGIVNQALALLTTEIEIKDLPKAPNLKIIKGKISFKKVNFSYNDSAQLFHDLNVEIKPNEKVGLVGYSGGGKSTFINLILRFFDVTSGSIEIDDQDIREVTQDSIRDQIAIVPQDNTLFHRSLRDNLLYANENATDADIKNVLKKASCNDFVAKFPEDLELAVGERGLSLSGGQRQRVAIARAMLKKSKILIMDEATSSLDSLTEEFIQSNLKQIMKNKTTIVIAHRLSTLKAMDRIIVFDNGKIVEDGSHEDLLKKRGHYFQLYQKQANGMLINEIKS